MTMVIRSRTGNVVLALLGAIYAVAGAVTLAVYAIDGWNAAGLIDRLFQFGLAGAACAGVWFVTIGLHNLGFDLQRWRPRH